MTLFSTLIILTSASAETLLSEAKVVKTDERGFVLQVGTSPLAVEDSYQTRFWKDKQSVKRDAFQPGDLVCVRIKTDVDPPQLREIADRPTQAWLDSIRKDFKRGTVGKIDSKFLTMKFDDGSSFAYRATDKTAVTLKGAKSSLSSVDEGMTLYAKGRLLPSLDTFVAELTDAAPAVKAKGPEKGAKVKLSALKPDGLLEGQVLKHHPEISMFDIEADRLLHITYTPATKFTLDGQPASRDAIKPRLRVKIAYKRDKAGRIIASKVDLFAQ